MRAGWDYKYQGTRTLVFIEDDCPLVCSRKHKVTKWKTTRLTENGGKLFGGERGTKALNPGKGQ